MPQPNVVLFHADSWDGRLLGRLSDAPVETPNVDRFLDRGTCFRNTYCNTPLCCPSRASFWSGLYPHEIGAWNNYEGLPRGSEQPLAVDFRERGYEAETVWPHEGNPGDFRSGGHSLGARVSSWLRATEMSIVLSGPRTDVDGEGRRVNDPDWDAVEAAVDRLDARDPGDDPFFLSVGVRTPHPYRTTSDYWLDRIDSEAISLPPADDPHPVTEHMQACRGCADGFDDDEARFLRRRYYAMIAEADAMFGELLDAIDRNGLADSTHVVFFGDHGEMNTEHDLVFKSAMYEPSARVPLVVAGPDVPAGSVVEDPVSLVDLYPTALDLAGHEPPTDVDGESLVPSLTGSDDDRRDWVLSQYHGNDQQTGSFMLRRGRWKYVAYPGFEPQLFDLEADPDEIDNRADARPDVVEEMDDRLASIVDYETVDEQVKAYDRRAFRGWRASLSDREYDETMSDLLPAWDDARKRRVEAWLEG